MKTYMLAEAEFKIQQLEKENAMYKTTAEINTETMNMLFEENDTLKYKFANQKYLDRQEVEKILHDKLSTNYKTLIIDICGIDEAVTAICNLAYKIDKDKQ